MIFGPASPWRYLHRALLVAGFCLVVALGLGLARGSGAAAAAPWTSQLFGIARGGDWRRQLVYSEAIGLSIWMMLDLGRLLFKRDPDSQWPIGWRAPLLQVGGVIGGYLLGTWIGDQYCGCSTFEL